MRQVWISKTGGPEVLEVREAPDPEAWPGQVRIRVKAAGINFADIMARVGLYPDAPKLPAVVGYEVSGIIDQLGEGVEGFSLGDSVMALTTFGGYSDVVTVKQDQVSPIPDGLGFEKAAALPVNYLTAWLMLVTTGNVQAGDKVLVHAVAGGVGQAAAQICKWRGATIIGTASAAKHGRLKEAGVTHCIDYSTQDFEKEVMRVTEGRGVDIVLDAVGGESFRKSYRCLAPLGKLFMFGASSMSTGTKRSILAVLKGLIQMPRFHPIPLMNKNRGVFGFNLGHLWNEKVRIEAAMTKMLDLITEGHLDPVVDRSFPFDEAGKAHAYIQDRKNFGKVLLVP